MILILMFYRILMICCTVMHHLIQLPYHICHTTTSFKAPLYCFLMIPLINLHHTNPLPEFFYPIDDEGGEQGSCGVPSTVEEDRRHLVEASIVRVMKARKRLSHNDLVAEISRQLAHRFIPSPQVTIFLPSHFFSSLSHSLFLFLSLSLSLTHTHTQTHNISVSLSLLHFTISYFLYFFKCLAVCY